MREPRALSTAAGQRMFGLSLVNSSFRNLGQVATDHSQVRRICSAGIDRYDDLSHPDSSVTPTTVDGRHGCIHGDAGHPSAAAINGWKVAPSIDSRTTSA